MSLSPRELPEAMDRLIDRWSDSVERVYYRDLIGPILEWLDSQPADEGDAADLERRILDVFADMPEDAIRARLTDLMFAAAVNGMVGAREEVSRAAKAAIRERATGTAPA